MNGVHDMGGMHGMGPVSAERDEPVFHEKWEGRAYALVRAMGAWRKWNIDASRHQRELIPAPEYLRMSYYEKWVAGLEKLLLRHGLVTHEELCSGRAAAGSVRHTPALLANSVASLTRRGDPANRDVPVPARFRAGQQVRALNLNPLGHTRLPRYVRGRVGTVDRDHGVFVYPDSNAHFAGEQPHHLYSVRFTARELWGSEASELDTVQVDLWESYLEPA